MSSTDHPTDRPADRSSGSPGAFRDWAALLGGLVIGGIGVWFLMIGHTGTLVSVAQVGCGAWMVFEGLRGLLRRAAPNGAAPNRRAAGDDAGEQP